jgi:hypothetical protein
LLRVLGLGGERHFVNFHRVLSCAVWSPRTTPVILALFSIVTLLAMRLRDRTGALPIRAAASYVKPRTMFADALALVRAHLRRHRGLSLSGRERNVRKSHHGVLKQLHEAVCYAA